MKLDPRADRERQTADRNKYPQLAASAPVPPSRRSPCEDLSRRRQSRSACPRATRSSAQQIDQPLEDRGIHGTVAANARATGQFDLDIRNGGGTETLGFLGEPDRQQLDLLCRTSLVVAQKPSLLSPPA